MLYGQAIFGLHVTHTARGQPAPRCPRWQPRILTNSILRGCTAAARWQPRCCTPRDESLGLYVQSLPLHSRSIDGNEAPHLESFTCLHAGIHPLLDLLVASAAKS